MANYALVTAAGRSRRMGGANKLLLEFEGLPVLVHTLRRFQQSPLIEGIALSAPPDQLELYHQLCQAHALTKVGWVVAGGSERQYSISNALEEMQIEPDDVVMIHDGARPLIDEQLLARLVEGLAGAQGVLPMLPLKDTIKRVQQGVVECTLDRSVLFAAQTPQVFPFQAIRAAHRQARQQDFLGTDDASLIEWVGGKVVMVEGKATNIKITTPDDLVLMRVYLEAESVGR
ncbi:MAG: 2-C-methyl-D-erythritol 4-phosphate cytidylyltransferase [Candidatus Eremiobacteraeota bacterium]|nr:2-C-methyl-D-erythritol 4-phosphate cytidylyltransferase [Candidatus Eremiobacteraeota bacterium]